MTEARVSQKTALKNYEYKYVTVLKKVEKAISKAIEDGKFYFTIPAAELVRENMDINNFCRYLMAKGYEPTIIPCGYLGEDAERIDVVF